MFKIYYHTVKYTVNLAVIIKHTIDCRDQTQPVCKSPSSKIVLDGGSRRHVYTLTSVKHQRAAKTTFSYSDHFTYHCDLIPAWL